MSSFFRSSDGIANQPLFSQSRFVVYVEEDPQLDPSRSIDKPFWRLFFGSIMGEKNVEIKPLGGKRHVLAMARTIIDRSIPNSICALDRDYDNMFGELIDDERVFYTHGYGVENDLLNEDTVGLILRHSVPGTVLSDVYVASLWTTICQTYHADRMSLYSDQLASRRKRATLDRDKPISCLDLERRGVPIRLKRKRISAAIKKAKNFAVAKPAPGHLSHQPEDAPCHLHFELVFHTVARFLSSITKAIPNKEMFRVLALGAMRECMFAGTGNVCEFYKSYGSRNINKFSTLPPS